MPRSPKGPCQWGEEPNDRSLFADILMIVSDSFLLLLVKALVTNVAMHLFLLISGELERDLGCFSPHSAPAGQPSCGVELATEPTPKKARLSMRPWVKEW